MARYGVVQDCAKELGWEVHRDEDADGWTIMWIDSSIGAERLVRAKPFQRLNHFPGMNLFARKAGLARSLNRMQHRFPDDFAFHPKTYVLPEDWITFSAMMRQKKRTTYIVKPSVGAQGRGIFLTRSLEGIDPTVAQVAQRYLPSPFLLDGLKFDLRVYVLVVSCHPLRVFLFDDGLVRLCTRSYAKPSKKNLDNACMHLTNYSINKHSEDFVYNSDANQDGEGSKRSLRWLFGWLQSRGHDAGRVWARIAHMVNKTLISGQPELSHTYRTAMGLGGFRKDTTMPTRTCFEILGFDVLLDHKLRPWLLEINHSPSFTCDSPLDTRIKRSLLGEAMRLLALRATDRKRHAVEEASQAQSRLYTCSRPSRGGAEAAPSARAKTPRCIMSASEALETSETAEISPEEDRYRRLEEKRSSHWFRIFPLYGTEAYDKWGENGPESTAGRLALRDPLEPPSSTGTGMPATDSETATPVDATPREGEEEGEDEGEGAAETPGAAGVVPPVSEDGRALPPVGDAPILPPYEFEPDFRVHLIPFQERYRQFLRSATELFDSTTAVSIPQTPPTPSCLSDSPTPRSTSSREATAATTKSSSSWKNGERDRSAKSTVLPKVKSRWSADEARASARKRQSVAPLSREGTQQRGTIPARPPRAPIARYGQLLRPPSPLETNHRREQPPSSNHRGKIKIRLREPVSTKPLPVASFSFELPGVKRKSSARRSQEQDFGRMPSKPSSSRAATNALPGTHRQRGSRSETRQTRTAAHWLRLVEEDRTRDSLWGFVNR